MSEHRGNSITHGVLELADAIEPLSPKTIIYIDRGGRPLGAALAARLGLPAFALDMSYPLSRGLAKCPRCLQFLAWPIKELFYKLQTPKLGQNTFSAPLRCPVVLVDDSASSGKTLRGAVAFLDSRAVKRKDIITVVWRRGARAAPWVDFYVTTKISGQNKINRGS